MKILRIGRWHGHCLLLYKRSCQAQKFQLRSLGTTSPNNTLAEAAIEAERLMTNTSSNIPLIDPQISSQYPSPLPERALHSTKLAALHARLALSKRLPLQTLARTLVDPSADQDSRFNNLGLARLGQVTISYYVGEYLVCKFPRLPISVMFAASYAYNGPQTLQLIAQEWGVETAAAPGSEVDPGLLQFSKLPPGTKIRLDDISTRPDAFSFFRRGMTSRLIYDDEFGDKMPRNSDQTLPTSTELAFSGFVKALVGAIYVHAGQKTAKTFVKQQILSRHLDISTLFQFSNPIRELARLCNREGFELPVARIYSETGRWTRSPVFVVGIYSGKNILGCGEAASLPEARVKGCAAALKSWYLYSPGNDVKVPSDTEGRDSVKEWEPVYIDPGEIVLS